MEQILIVGRTNVGKSALFNRIVGQQLSMVYDEPGITRDWIEAEATYGNHKFQLVDSGGLESDGIFSDQIRQIVVEKLKTCSLAILVCDVRVGVTLGDLEIAKILKKSGSPVLVAANKCDDKAKEDDVFQFCKLGLGTPIAISAIHGRGMEQLLSQSISILQSRSRLQVNQNPDPNFKIAIIGKPNVGKSSLMNCILKTNRSIVSDIAGTTRENISDFCFYKDKFIKITDTAGVRRKRSVETDLEELMVKSSMEAIRTSELVVLLVDATETRLSAQELKLLNYATERKKALVIALNKSDLVSPEALKKMQDDFEFEYENLSKNFPIVKISAHTGKNVDRLLTRVEQVLLNCKQKIDNQELFEVISSAMVKSPIFKQRTSLQILSIKSVEEQRIPTFDIKVNRPELFEDPELRAVENILRRNYSFQGCPIRINIVNKRPGLYKLA